jgi:hypothetical protein
MSDIVSLKIPEPTKRNGRDYFLGGWSTGGIFNWLLAKKLGEPTDIGEMAVAGYSRNNPGNRSKACDRIPALRRYAADRDEFLLTFKDSMRRIAAVKIANPTDERDCQMAREQILRLAATGEIAEAERLRWEQRFLLPSSLPPV